MRSSELLLFFLRIFLRGIFWFTTGLSGSGGDRINEYAKDQECLWMLITVTIHNDLFLSIIVFTLCRDHASFFILTSLVDIPCQVEAAGAHQVIPIEDAQLNHVSNPLPALVIVALLNLLVKRLLDVSEACLFFNRLEVRRKLLAIAS